MATTTESLQEAALDYARQGWGVFPCGRNKKPLIEGGFHAASSEPDQINAWWARWPRASIGTAVPESLAVIDVDGLEGKATLAGLVRDHGKLPTTLTCRTGGGGWHLYYLHPGGELRQGSGVLGPGLDTRMPGKGYTILPPSGHPSGRRYTWRDPEAPIARLPTWIALRLRPPPRRRPAPAPAPDIEAADAYVQAAVEGETEAVRTAPVGARNETLHRAACALGTLVGAGLLGEREARAALLHAAADYIADDGELAAQRTIRSGLEWGAQHPRKVEA